MISMEKQYNFNGKIIKFQWNFVINSERDESDLDFWRCRSESGFSVDWNWDYKTWCLKKKRRNNIL